MNESDQTFPTILLIGDIISGYYPVGPFPSWAAAQSYADDQFEPYLIADLNEPWYPEEQSVEEEDEEEDEEEEA